MEKINDPSGFFESNEGKDNYLASILRVAQSAASSLLISSSSVMNQSCSTIISYLHNLFKMLILLYVLNLLHHDTVNSSAPLVSSNSGI